MGYRLLEGGTAERLVARLPPPFDGEIVEAGLSKMMRDRFGLSVGGDQRLGRAAVERLAVALEQALIGRVLNQRVLESVVRLRSIVLDEQNVGFGEPLQRRLQRAFVEASHGLEQRIREAAA